MAWATRGVAPVTLCVLHVVGGLGVGGTETWLTKGLPFVDRERYGFDFLVFGPERRHYEEMIERSGARIWRCCGPRNLLLFVVTVLRLLRRERYDAVHAHIYCASGIVLALAAAAGVRTRVFHSHTAQDEQNARGWRGWYFRSSRRMVRRFATRWVAVSAEAAAPFFRAHWGQAAEKYRICPIGVDLRAFENSKSGDGVRRELGIPESAKVAIHVGRFVTAKNHEFLVRIAEQVVRRRVDVVFLLVGDGPERTRIEERVRALGLGEWFRFAGLRDDVARLLQASDVFVMPSRYEGFPLAFVEAQAAGLPCVISDVIAPAADVESARVTRLSLAESSAGWAQALVDSAEEPRSRPEARLLAPLSLEASMQRMLECYQ